MKLTCDLCDGELEMKGNGAVCRNCGLEYGEDRLKEKRTEIKPPVVEKPPVKDIPPVKKDLPPVKKDSPRKPSAAETAKEQKRMKAMWIILALIGLFAFFSTLFSDGVLPLVSFPALLITLFVFKPWKVYGGKAI